MNIVQQNIHLRIHGDVTDFRALFDTWSNQSNVFVMLLGTESVSSANTLMVEWLLLLYAKSCYISTSN